jgi:hypothetical protein
MSVHAFLFVQQGCFTIHSYQGPLNKREGHDQYLRGLRIPVCRIRELAFELDVCGSRKGDIFSDYGRLAED